jgi:DNA-binding GntR family transcriptional regulator
MEKQKHTEGRSVQDAVYTALRKSIMSLNLAPGTAISEKEISLRYKVSRTPVREAFIHLSKEGLIKVIPQKETLVTRIDFKRVAQEFFLRESLEIAVLEPFLASCRRAHFDGLEEFIARQEAAARGGEFVSFLEYDDSFHRTFFEAAGKNICWEVMDAMNGHYRRVRLLSIWLNDIAEDVVAQHKKLFRALKKKDLLFSRRELAGHLRKITLEEPLMREAYPDYFMREEENDSFDVDFGGLRLSPGGNAAER